MSTLPKSFYLSAISPATFSARPPIQMFLEKGKYNPSLRLAHDVAKALKTTIEELFVFEEGE